MSTRQCDSCNNKAVVKIVILRDESSGHYCVTCAIDYVDVLKIMRFDTDTTLYTLQNRPLHS